MFTRKLSMECNAPYSPPSGMLPAPRGHFLNNDDEFEMKPSLETLQGSQHDKNHSLDCSQKTLETLPVEEYSESSEQFGVVVPDGDVDRQNVPQPMFLPNVFWGFICSFLVPVMAQAIFGGYYIVRTLILGYTLQYTMKVTETAAVQWFLATPPPPLICLVLLTVVAFIVHPDGFTWILLRKTRNGLLLLIESSSTCWAVAVNDYGTIVSSVLAILTFAGLLSLVFVMHRTLTSKTPQHRARHPQSEKQKRKKRKSKPKDRIRTTQYVKSRNVEELMDEAKALTMENEQPSCVLPPLVEDKPMLDTVCLRTAPYDEQEMERRVRGESFDSNFEDSSSCETSVSSASVATPNRRLHNTLDQKYNKPMNNSRRRLETKKNETSRGQRTETAVKELKPPLKTQTITGPSRWDILKPEAHSSERYAPPNRRGRRRGKKQQKRHFLPSLDGTERHQFAQTPFGIEGTNPYTPASTATLPSFETVPVVEDGLPKGQVVLGSNADNADNATWKAQCSAPFLAQPPGLSAISKEIPFGCCSNSDDGYSAPPSLFYQEPSFQYIEPTIQPLFGAIGPSLPFSGDCSRMENTSYLTGSFDAASTSFRSYEADVPFDLLPSALSDDDKIEAQLQELGGQMVCSVLDF